MKFNEWLRIIKNSIKNIIIIKHLLHVTNSKLILNQGGAQFFFIERSASWEHRRQEALITKK